MKTNTVKFTIFSTQTSNNYESVEVLHDTVSVHFLSLDVHVVVTLKFEVK